MARRDELEVGRAELEGGGLPPVCVLTGARQGVAYQPVALPRTGWRAGLLQALAGGALLSGVGAATWLAGLPIGTPAGTLAFFALGALGWAALLDGRFPRPLPARLPVVPAALRAWEARQRQARWGTLGLALGGGLALVAGRSWIADPWLASLVGSLLPLAAMLAAQRLRDRAATPRLGAARVGPARVTLACSAAPTLAGALPPPAP